MLNQDEKGMVDVDTVIKVLQRTTQAGPKWERQEVLLLLNGRTACNSSMVAAAFSWRRASQINRAVQEVKVIGTNEFVATAKGEARKDCISFYVFHAILSMYQPKAVTFSTMKVLAALLSIKGIHSVSEVVGDLLPQEKKISERSVRKSIREYLTRCLGGVVSKGDACGCLNISCLTCSFTVPPSPSDTSQQYRMLTSRRSPRS